ESRFIFRAFASRDCGGSRDSVVDRSNFNLGYVTAAVAALVCGDRRRRTRCPGCARRRSRAQIVAVLVAGTARVLRADYVRRDFGDGGIYEQMVGERTNDDCGRRVA